MPAEVLGFEDFELDRSAYQLRHKGRPVRLERIPLDLLFLLAERRGQLVTREEIIERIGARTSFSIPATPSTPRCGRSAAPCAMTALPRASS